MPKETKSEPLIMNDLHSWPGPKKRNGGNSLAAVENAFPGTMTLLATVPG
jgi:hypothetical protein